jgi:sulfur carrier protein ThiS
MGRGVTLELWLGENPGDPFVQVSPVRCLALLEVEEGKTVKELFQELSSKCSRIGDMVFDPNSGRFRPDVVVVKNDRLVSRESVLGEAVSPGDSIRVVPLYMGG